jgi:hypothetical protein
MSYIAAAVYYAYIYIVHGKYIPCHRAYSECVCVCLCGYFFKLSICSLYCYCVYIFFFAHLDRRGRPVVTERNPMALSHRRSVFHHDHRWVHSARRTPHTTHTHTHTHTHVRDLHDLERGYVVSFF